MLNVISPKICGMVDHGVQVQMVTMVHRIPQTMIVSIKLEENLVIEYERKPKSSVCYVTMPKNPNISSKTAKQNNNHEYIHRKNLEWQNDNVKQEEEEEVSKKSIAYACSMLPNGRPKWQYCCGIEKNIFFHWQFFLSFVISATKNAKGNKSGKSKSEYEGKRNLFGIEIGLVFLWWWRW